MRSTLRLRSRSNQLDSRVSGRIPPGSDPYIWNILPLGIRLRCVDEHADLPRRAHDVLADALLLCEGGDDVLSARKLRSLSFSWMVSTWTTLQGSPIQPPRDEVDLVLDILIVVVGELPHSVLGVGIDEHGKEHLAFERLDVSDVLGHGAGEVVHSRVVGGETGSSSSSDPSFFHGWPASQHTTTCADVCLLHCEAGLFVSFRHRVWSGAAEVPCEPNTEHSIRRSVPSPTTVFCIRSQAT